MTLIPEDLNYNLAARRESCDSTVSGRGQTLTECFSHLDLVLLNGRSLSDASGSHTFVSHQGCSVVDFIWTSAFTAQTIYDFAVEEASISDHQPCSVLIQWSKDTYEAVQQQKDPVETAPKFRWVSEKADDFRKWLNDTAPSTIRNTPKAIYDEIKSSIQKAACASDMLIKSKPKNHETDNNQPWFDKECRIAKASLNKALRICKKQLFKTPFLHNYLLLKSEFKKLVTEKRNEYNNGLIKIFSSSSSPKDFWAAVKRLRDPGRRDCVVSRTEWEAFYDDVLPSRQRDKTDFYGVEDPLIDTQITTKEVLEAIKSLKLKKSPGIDGIRNEFLRALPITWINHVTLLFNSILTTEELPADLIDIEVVMIYKKGEPTDPRNYRGISLINTVLKIFTSIMLKRLETWVEDCNILPESQAGFRKKRGCVDHIFTLDALRQISKRRRRKRKLHLVFVDFARAFDSINHQKLWNRLNDIGVSSKFIRIFQDLYSKATMRVRTKSGHTKHFDVAEGVLQGELTSPLFFALYISDIDDIFKIMESQGIRGININSRAAIHLLAYADDLIILADCPSHLQDKLNELAIYCRKKELTVNVAKTKILIFSHHHNSRHKTEFTFNNRPIEIVEEFKYLGVTFCSCGKFHKHLAEIKMKCSSVMSSIISIILRSRSQSWHTVEKLLDTLLISIPLYASEIWSLQYVEEIEKMRLTFLKRVLTLPQYTPGYMIRLETGLTHISRTILDRSLRWWLKTTEMEESRTPKLCMRELLKLDQENPDTSTTCSRGSWVQSVKNLMTTAAPVNIHDLTSETRYSDVKAGVIATGLNSQEADLDRCNQSSFSLLYSRLKTNTKMEEYLNFPISFHKKRLFAQLRLHPEQLSILHVYVDRCKYVFHPSSRCSVCNEPDNDDLFHHVCLCKIYHPFRNQEKLTNISRRSFHKYFKYYDLNFIHYIYKFMKVSLCVRSFCLNE
ncbi:unnamed protein product [Orchesella dallaii]|uniref:Reverse transcriptase domain-containing protein n=3 Tax=Orchesella dallaii TaxID=48710 RepID=A0ABP1QY59_9HEXA